MHAEETWHDEFSLEVMTTAYEVERGPRIFQMMRNVDPDDSDDADADAADDHDDDDDGDDDHDDDDDDDYDDDDDDDYDDDNDDDDDEENDDEKVDRRRGGRWMMKGG